MARSLLVKVYLWFLVAMFLTIASVAGVFVLFAEEWRKSVSDQMIERVSDVRDVIQRLMQKGISESELSEVLKPLIDQHPVSVVIVDKKGRVRWAMRSKRLPEGESILPDKDTIARARQEGAVVGLEAGRELSLALPINLTASEVGVFYVEARRPSWNRAGGAGRLALGLLLVLLVGFLVCFLLARSVSAPLRRLALIAERFGGGELAARMPEHGATEVRQVAHSFNRMADRLSGVLDDKRRLLSDISHELKTPLARLRLALELAQPGTNDEARAFLTRADGQVTELDGLIDELLLYSKLESQPYAAERVEQPVAELLSQLAQPRLAIVQKGGTSFPLDRRLFIRALKNVVDNALRYGSHATLTLEVSASALRCTIVDDGPGVPEAERGRIFEAFYRVDAARAQTTDKGHGLGLAIAKRCIEAHGGQISAKAVLPSGLCVLIDVPRS